MTIVNKTHKFIFVHVPKTAGTSLKQHFRRYAGREDVHIVVWDDMSTVGPNHRSVLKKHSTAMEIRAAIGKETFNQFFKFAVVRNPFARVVSIYRFLKYKFRGWERADVMDGFESLEDFVTSKFFLGSGPGGIFRPQVRWLSDGEGRLCMDYLCRVESLERDIAHIHDKLTLPSPDSRIEKKNISGGDLSAIESELSSSAVAAAIRERYREDFELLCYDSNPNDALPRSIE